jgi:type II secretory pathway pseudopilin PulG
MRRDAGISLVEVLVAMGLFGLLGTLLLGFAISTSQVTDDTRKLSGVNEESRLAMERFSRELRQANQILTFTLPGDPATDPIALTFWTDFNGNGTQDLSATDPEVLTYRWNPINHRLTLTANDPTGAAVTRPVLASNVSAFSLDLNSSLWEYDHDHSDGSAGSDGVTSWREIDKYAPPLIGNNDGTPDPSELELVDLVSVTMTVLDGPHRQTYTSEVDLRNRNQN